MSKSHLHVKERAEVDDPATWQLASDSRKRCLIRASTIRRQGRVARRGCDRCVKSNKACIFGLGRTCAQCSEDNKPCSGGEKALRNVDEGDVCRDGNERTMMADATDLFSVV